jgi:hypothetical protein
MKLQRVVFSILSGLIIFTASLMAVAPAQASMLQPPQTVGFSLFTGSDSADETSAFKQLKSEVMPRLSEILTPRQQEMFKESISSGESFRKTFRSLMLTPDQKREIKSVINTVPRRDAFAALTPIEKKELFLKKKEVFMPSSEEIIDKIKAKTPEGVEIPEEIQEKIKTGVKMRDTFMPTSEEIMDKIKAGMENAEKGLDKMKDSLDD